MPAVKEMSDWDTHCTVWCCMVLWHRWEAGWGPVPPQPQAAGTGRAVPHNESDQRAAAGPTPSQKLAAEARRGLRWNQAQAGQGSTAALTLPCPSPAPPTSARALLDELS